MFTSQKGPIKVGPLTLQKGDCMPARCLQNRNSLRSAARIISKTLMIGSLVTAIRNILRTNVVPTIIVMSAIYLISMSSRIDSINATKSLKVRERYNC